MKARQCISLHCSIVTPHPAPSLCRGFVLVYTALYEGTPVYLVSLLHRHTPPRTLALSGVCSCTLHSMKARQCISSHCSIVTPHPAPSLCRWFVLVHTALYEGTPVYLASLLHRHTPPRTLALLGVCSCTLHSMKARQCISSHCSIVTPHPTPSLCRGFVLVHTALYEGTPVYLASLLHRHTPPRTLALSGVCSCTHCTL